MPRGRKPVGEHALSNAERQARYRGSPLEANTARHDPNAPADRSTQPPQRWADATNALLGLQAEYVDWLAGSARQPARQSHR